MIYNIIIIHPIQGRLQYFTQTKNWPHLAREVFFVFMYFALQIYFPQNEQTFGLRISVEKCQRY